METIMILQFQALDLAMGTSGNEYALVIPPGALDVHIQLRDTTNTVKLYTVGVGNQGSPSNYFTLNPGKSLELRSRLGGQTIYAMPSANTTVLEACWIADT